MLKIRNLLSDNDWDDLRCHLLAMRPYVLTRALGDVTVSAEVSSVNSPAWRVSMVITLTATRRGFLQRQNFESVEEAKKELATWAMFDEGGFT